MTDQSSRPRPRVSVIIATYNYSAVLRYAIQTVLWQTFGDFELIVAGDCCSDDSEQLVRSFDDSRIRWLNLPENSGSKSLPQNAAIAIARAELIAYLAHDDLWHPEHLATAVRAIEESGADFAYTVALYVPPAGQTQRNISGVFPTEFRSGHVLVHSSVIHRMDVIEKIGGWPDYRETRMPGDHLFWIRAAEAGLRFQSVPKVTVWKFNASSRPGSYITKRSDEQARYFALIRDDPALVEKELIDVARSAMVDGLRPLETVRSGRDAPPGAFIEHLRRIRGLDPTEPMRALPSNPDQQLLHIAPAFDLPVQLRAGEKIEVEARIQNDTDFTLFSHPPHPVHAAYHWRRPDGSPAVWDGFRTALIPPLPARTALHYFMTIVAPTESGRYELELAMVQEGARWFEGIVAGICDVR